MKKSKKELEMLYNLWFDTNSSELLEGWPVEERDANYYVNQFYEQIVFDLPIPENGKLLVLGTHNCVSFDKLCIHFGYDRCIGFDLFNPTRSDFGSVIFGFNFNNVSVFIWLLVF